MSVSYIGEEKVLLRIDDDGNRELLMQYSFEFLVSLPHSGESLILLVDFDVFSSRVVDGPDRISEHLFTIVTAISIPVVAPYLSVRMQPPADTIKAAVRLYDIDTIQSVVSHRIST